MSAFISAQYEAKNKRKKKVKTLSSLKRMKPGGGMGSRGLREVLQMKERGLTPEMMDILDDDIEDGHIDG